MVKGKIIGITFGGLAGYLLLSKVFNVVQNSVAYVTDASKWKAYYKYGTETGEGGVNCIVPPGYSSCTRTIGKDREYVVEDPKQKQNAENSENPNTSKSDLKAELAHAITKAINDLLDGKKAPEGAKEGQREASEDDISCPQDCDFCTLDKCPHEKMKMGGKITEWDENGTPVAGRYPWTEGTECSWSIVEAEEDPFDKAPGDPEPLYHDDLYDGVKVEYPEEEEKENGDETLG